MQKPFASQQEIAVMLSITKDSVKWNINKLRNSGVIRRVGPDRGGY